MSNIADFWGCLRWALSQGRSTSSISISRQAEAFLAAAAKSYSIGVRKLNISSITPPIRPHIGAWRMSVCVCVCVHHRLLSLQARERFWASNLLHIPRSCSPLWSRHQQSVFEFIFKIAMTYMITLRQSSLRWIEFSKPEKESSEKPWEDTLVLQRLVKENFHSHLEFDTRSPYCAWAQSCPRSAGRHCVFPLHLPSPSWRVWSCTWEYQRIRTLFAWYSW